MSATPRSGPARGQAILAIGTVLLLVGAFAWLEGAGAKDPAAPTTRATSSGAWLCPHGGGRDWTVALFLANPGTTAVTVRITEMGLEAPERPDLLEVAPRGTARVDLEARGRGDATYVEYFGGWIGAGWVTVAGPGEEGAAAEPCASDASRRWLLADGTTQLQEEAYTIVSNPFDVTAVLDVAIYTPDRAPIRDSEWTDLSVPARRSIALHLNEKVEGEPAVAVELDVSVGRVVAASLGVTDETKVRSALGWRQAETGAVFPVTQGSGETELLVLSTAGTSMLFGATSLSEDQPHPAAGLTEQEHGPTAVRSYAIPVEAGPGAIQAFTLGGSRVAAAFRTLGPGGDPAATAGTASPSPSWVVMPAAAGRSEPGVVLVNPGEEDAIVTALSLAREGGTAAEAITVEVPARSAATVPPEFLETAPGAAVVVRSDGAPIVALAATTSIGDDGDAFALSMGVPLPHEL